MERARRPGDQSPVNVGYVAGGRSDIDDHSFAAVKVREVVTSSGVRAKLGRNDGRTRNAVMRCGRAQFDARIFPPQPFFVSETPASSVTPAGFSFPDLGY